MQYYNIALLSLPYSTLTYGGGDFVLSPGCRVLVPLGKGQARVGLVMEAISDPPQGVQVRSVVFPLEHEPLLSREQLELFYQLALRQAQPVGRILGTVLPAGLRTSKHKLRVFQEQGRPKLYSPFMLSTLDENEFAQIVKIWKDEQAQWTVSQEDSAAIELCSLTKDPPWDVRKSAVNQLKILEFLWEKGQISRRMLLQSLGQNINSSLQTLIKNNLISISQVEPQEQEQAALLAPELKHEFTLTDEQQNVLQDLTAALNQRQALTRLLYGITGSGKTVIYLELARACLEQGRSVMLLAPELALALKMQRDVKNSLPQIPIFFYHGYQTPQLREQIFRNLSSFSEPCIIVGTRSALFLPCSNLGLLVLDEEHDSSFKQDEGLNYQAKDVAWFRSSQHQALLLLGSATPDLKTYHASQTGHIPLSILKNRVGGGTLPQIRLVDICSANVGESLLVPETLQALQAVVERGEQAVIMLNRRGYAPMMYCLDCGKVARCPQCEIGLTYHKGRERLVCHYCGYSLNFPVVCPSCKGLHYLPMGQGTERLEEHLNFILPTDSKVLRLDRDSTRRPGRMEEILSAFARQEAQILVGTQMLSKGHHFPNVTLAVIADGDLGLNLPDYRAAERTFQLLVQSAGRAGRGTKAGEVIIQTRDTKHYCWQFIQNADYDNFYFHEIALRQKRQYPPFVKLAIMRLNFPMNQADGAEILSEWSRQIKAAKGQAIVLGPAPSPLPILGGRRRFQCLIKAKDWNSIRAVYNGIKFKNQDIRLSLDLDPVNML